MGLSLAVLTTDTPQVALFMMAQQLPTVTIMVGTRHQEDLHTITTVLPMTHGMNSDTKSRQKFLCFLFGYCISDLVGLLAGRR